MIWKDILDTRAPAWSILIRFLVGLAVFFLEGIQKLAFPDDLGAGRFAHWYSISKRDGAACRHSRDGGLRRANQLPHYGSRSMYFCA
jgi:hypothetical protein